MTTATIHPTTFWTGFIRALEAEPLEAKSIQGASALHQVNAVGLDRPRRRLIVVFDEKDPARAALQQADVQSAHKAIEVIGAVVRPVLVKNAPVDADQSKNGLASGICPIPFHELDAGEVDLISRAEDTVKIKLILRQHQLHQYFFPAADQLSLGLIESGRTRVLAQLIDQLVRTPDLGHPFGPTELMPTPSSFTEMVKELQNLDLIVEMEGSFQLTDEGRSTRALVRDTPREALLFKILNRISASLYLKSLLHPDLYSRRR